MPWSADEVRRDPARIRPPTESERFADAPGPSGCTPTFEPKIRPAPRGPSETSFRQEVRETSELEEQTGVRSAQNSMPKTTTMKHQLNTAVLVGCADDLLSRLRDEMEGAHARIEAE